MPLPLDLDPAAPDNLVAPLADDHSEPGQPVPKAMADELACVAAWLDKEAGQIRVIHSDRGLASTYPALPSYVPAA